MADYTIELRKIINIYTRDVVKSWFMDYELSHFLLPEQLQVVLNTPIWSKERLANKILDHYYMREIGFETPALFEHYAKITMKEIMQSKLLEIYTTALEYEPLVNVDYTETFKRSASGTGTNEGTSNSTSNNNSSGLNVSSDTPQGQINKSDILSGSYATSTSASESQASITDTTKTNSSGSSQNQEEYTRKWKGNQGISATYQAMIKQFRENIRAVDYEIIQELNQLFIRFILIRKEFYYVY